MEAREGVGAIAGESEGVDGGRSGCEATTSKSEVDEWARGSAAGVVAVACGVAGAASNSDTGAAADEADAAMVVVAAMGGTPWVSAPSVAVCGALRVGVDGGTGGGDCRDPPCDPSRASDGGEAGVPGEKSEVTKAATGMAAVVTVGGAVVGWVKDAGVADAAMADTPKSEVARGASEPAGAAADEADEAMGVDMVVGTVVVAAARSGCGCETADVGAGAALPASSP